MMVPVKDYPHLYRDEISGAIVNCDDRAYNEYVNSLNQREHQKIEIETLKNEVSEIKSLLKELINETRRN
jgi:predicted ATP-grasp superfamily ATP-dependent carboligase